MGGRGGSSTRGMESFYSPQLSGSEKQVSWARDILREPYINAGYRANNYEQINKKNKRKFEKRMGARCGCLSVCAKVYNENIKLLEKRFGGTIPAKTIIDRRFSFEGAMKDIIRKELDKQGRNPLKR